MGHAANGVTEPSAEIVRADTGPPAPFDAPAAEGDAAGELEVFLRREFDRGPVVRLVLSQLGQGGDSRVGEWDDLAGKGPDELAAELVERAKDDARSQAGDLRYGVAVYRAKDKPHTARKFVTIAGGASEFADDLDTQRYTANAVGTLAQLMAHNQTGQALNVKLTMFVVTMMQNRIRDLERQNQRLQDTHQRAVQAHEQYVSQQHQRDLETRRARFDELRQEKIFEQVMLVLPLIFRFAVGDKSPALALAGLEQQLHTLIGSLSPAQLTTVMGALEPAQQASFLQLAQSIAAKKTSSVDSQLRTREAQESARAAAPSAAAPTTPPAPPSNPRDPHSPR